MQSVYAEGENQTDKMWKVKVMKGICEGVRLSGMCEVKG